MAKIGRNERCDCGSGKKYKFCHGSGIKPTKRVPRLGIPAVRIEANTIQRERQQGLGKPIISAQLDGHRIVAVKNKLLTSKRWTTFETFLVDYMKIAMGVDWGQAEITKPLEQRHPILVWYHKLGESLAALTKESGRVHSVPMNGAAAAYLHLAYDLYTLQHNVELQAKLIARLQNRDNNFTGKRYEVYVAATLIRAGFDIEFENEDDRSSTHCEFTATYRRTGRSFSVEAKRREGNRTRLAKLLFGALSKHANHQRIVFIDFNTRDDTTKSGFLGEAQKKLRSLEGRLRNGQSYPSAYVFVTNTPWDHYLDEPAPPPVALADGFLIPEFGSRKVTNLTDLIDAREAHIEMHELIKSLKDHWDIPSTFDGDIPEYAFHTDAQRILIGNRSMWLEQDGVERLAVITHATVAESDSIAHVAVRFEDGHDAICRVPLSVLELAAWRRHPDTFFGTVGPRTSHITGPLETFDFLHQSLKLETRDKLLEAMASASDFEQLAKLDHSQLARIYAERLTNSFLSADRAALPPGVLRRVTI